MAACSPQNFSFRLLPCSWYPFTSPSPCPSALVTTSLFLIYGFVFVWFIDSFWVCFLYSTCDWNHVTFAFSAWSLISFSITPSKSADVANGKISSFIIIVFLCLCVYVFRHQIYFPAPFYVLSLFCFLFSWHIMYIILIKYTVLMKQI